MIRRREFITLLGGAVAAWPLTARAQQAARIRRVGLLLNLSENDLEAQRLLPAFREGLAQLGWADGHNLRIDYRWAIMPEPARALGVTFQVFEVQAADELEAAFARTVRDGMHALFITQNPVFFSRRNEVAELAMRLRLDDLRLS
jgi:hypothetical protein